MIEMSVRLKFMHDVNATVGAFATISSGDNPFDRNWPVASVHPLPGYAINIFTIKTDLKEQLRYEGTELTRGQCGRRFQKHRRIS
jgi:hypothetical protein